MVLLGFPLPLRETARHSGYRPRQLMSEQRVQSKLEQAPCLGEWRAEPPAAGRLEACTRSRIARLATVRVAA